MRFVCAMAMFLGSLVFLAGCGATPSPAASQSEPAGGSSQGVPAGPGMGATVGETAVRTPVDVVARVGDRVLTRSDLAAVVPPGSITDTEERQLVSNWVDRELLVLAARRRGIDREAAVKWQVADAEATVLLAALGDRVRAETGSETAARRALLDEVERLRAESPVSPATGARGNQAP